jgi:hypothetical protein
MGRKPLLFLFNFLVLRVGFSGWVLWFWRHFEYWYELCWELFTFLYNEPKMKG